MNLKTVNISHPLKYFYDLHRGELHNYYRDFISRPEYLSFNNKLWTYHFDELTGEVIDIEETFEEWLERQLKYNSNIILDFLYNKVNTDKKLIITHVYISKVKEDLTVLLNIFQASSIKGYKVVLESIKQIEQEINKRLLFNIEVGLSTQNKATQVKSIKDINDIQKSRSIRAFTWKGSLKDAQLYHLLHFFTKEKIIDTDFETLKSAFSGETLKKPLNIKWTILTKNKKYSAKSSLFYFLWYLSEKDLIDYSLDNDNIKSEYKRIEMIFCDFDGEPFRNLKQSKQNSFISKTPIKSKVISRIIDEMQTLSVKV